MEVSPNLPSICAHENQISLSKEQLELAHTAKKAGPVFIENIKELFSPKAERGVKEAIQERAQKVQEVLNSDSITVQRAFFSHFADNEALEMAAKIAEEHDFGKIDHRLENYDSLLKDEILTPEEKEIVDEAIAFQKEQKMLDRVLGYSSPYIQFLKTIQELEEFEKSDLTSEEKEKITQFIQNLKSSEEIFKITDVIIYEKSESVREKLKEKLVVLISEKIEKLHPGESFIIPGGFLASPPYGCLNQIPGHSTINQCTKNSLGGIDWVLFNSGLGTDLHNIENNNPSLVFPNKYNTGNVLTDSVQRKAFLQAYVGFLNPSKEEIKQREKLVEGDQTITQYYELFENFFKGPLRGSSLKPYHRQGGLDRCSYSSLQIYMSQCFKDDRALYLKFKNNRSEQLISKLHSIVETNKEGISYEHPMARFGMGNVSFFGILGATIAFFAGEEVRHNLSNTQLQTLLAQTEIKLGERVEKQKELEQLLLEQAKIKADFIYGIEGAVKQLKLPTNIQKEIFNEMKHKIKDIHTSILNLNKLRV